MQPLDSVIQSFARHYPPDFKETDRMCRNLHLPIAPPDLLLLFPDKTYVRLTPEMDQEFWVRWFKHDYFGMLCTSFWMVFYRLDRLCLWNTFTPAGMIFKENRVQGVNLICTKCGNVTYVDRSWFKSFSLDLRPALCCHKRITYHLVWRHYFWNLAFYNALLEPLKSTQHNVVLVPPPSLSWEPAHAKGATLVRSFSPLGVRERQNGQFVDRHDIHRLI